MTRWGTYYGKRYKQWMKDAKALVASCSTAPIGTTVRVHVVFAIPRSKTGKLETPVGDGDNYEKAIYDLLQTLGYLEDDRLITTATWKKRFVPYGQTGYTDLIIYEETEEIDL